MTGTNGQPHVCRPSTTEPVGTLWICPHCRSELVRQRIIPTELGRERILWVRIYDPRNGIWVPPDKRNRRRRAASHLTGGPQ